jgi:hypothetical protein
MSNGGVTRRHRLAVQVNDLVQPPGDASLRIGERYLLRPDAARPTVHTPLLIDQGHAMLGPRHVIPGPLSAIPYVPRPSSTARAFIAADTAPLNADSHRRAGPVRLPLHRLDPKALQTQNPSTLARRSHMSSLVCSNTERTPSDLPMDTGIAFPCQAKHPGRRAGRPPNSGPRKRPGLTKSRRSSYSRDEHHPTIGQSPANSLCMTVPAASRRLPQGHSPRHSAATVGEFAVGEELALASPTRHVRVAPRPPAFSFFRIDQTRSQGRDFRRGGARAF